MTKFNLMYSKSLFLFFFLVGILCVNAQEVSRISYPVTSSGVPLDFPMTGGVNAPQFSEVDYNNDGMMDLFIFDRAGNVMLTFRNEGDEYAFKSFFAKNFPDGLTGWVLLRDFDQDGAADIFAYSDSPGVDGIIVYKGFYDTNNEIRFNRFNFPELSQNILPIQQQGGAFTNLFVSEEDIPGIADMDGDGDLDVLTFGIGGGYINLYTNQSVEMGYGLDSLKFELETNCWGYVFEAGVTEVIDTSGVIGDCPGLRPDNSISDRHAGSTLCPYDENNDGALEVLIGDVSFTNINSLKNGGTAADAWITQQDTFFPGNSVSVDIPIFPAAFCMDLDFDGVRDVLVAPNFEVNAEDFKNSWFYKNVGTNENMMFEFQQDDFMTNHMIDHGTGSHPEFIDINQDGLLDLLIGNFSFFLPGGAKDPRIFYYENVGTATQPAFNLVDTDFLGMSTFATTSLSFSPAGGDLDGDGDIDLLIGEEFGGLFYAENTAGPGNPMTFAPIVFSYFEIDVGQRSAPFIIDLNRDGLLDLIVGERNGNVNYFQNTGTITNPQFSNDVMTAPNIERLGDIDTRVSGSTTGYTSPIILDFDSGYTLFTGSRKGNIEVYNNIDGNLDGVFDQVNADYGELKREGFDTNLTMADVNNDGVFEIFVGNLRGGISGFQTFFNLNGTVDTEDFIDNNSISIYPNPADNYITVQTQFDPKDNTTYKLYDTVGKVIKAGNIHVQKTFIDINQLANGIYFIEIENGENRIVEKVVVH